MTLIKKNHGSEFKKGEYNFPVERIEPFLPQTGFFLQKGIK